jgi:hypothetical protein
MSFDYYGSGGEEGKGMVKEEEAKEEKEKEKEKEDEKEKNTEEEKELIKEEEKKEDEGMKKEEIEEKKEIIEEKKDEEIKKEEIVEEKKDEEIKKEEIVEEKIKKEEIEEKKEDEGIIKEESDEKEVRESEEKKERTKEDVLHTLTHSQNTTTHFTANIHRPSSSLNIFLDARYECPSCYGAKMVDEVYYLTVNSQLFHGKSLDPVLEGASSSSSPRFHVPHCLLALSLKSTVSFDMAGIVVDLNRNGLFSLMSPFILESIGGLQKVPEDISEHSTPTTDFVLENTSGSSSSSSSFSDNPPSPIPSPTPSLPPSVLSATSGLSSVVTPSARHHHYLHGGRSSIRRKPPVNGFFVFVFCLFFLGFLFYQCYLKASLM